MRSTFWFSVDSTLFWDTALNLAGALLWLLAKKEKKILWLALCLYSTVKTFTSLHASTMVVVNGRSSGA